MATMDAIERARLIKLGSLVANHLQKHWNLLISVKKPINAEQTYIETHILQADITRLRGLGKILGPDSKDGRELFTSGDRVAIWLDFFHGMNIHESEITKLISLYQKRQNVSNAKASFETGTTKGNNVVDRYFISFVAEFLRINEAESESKSRCVFCNDVPSNGGALMACGGCKLAKYCDKLCHKLHWKKGHKKECGKVSTKAPEAAQQVAEDKIGESGAASEDDEVDGGVPLPKDGE